MEYFVSYEIFREPDVHLGYLVGSLSIGMIFSLMMIFLSIIFYKKVTQNPKASDLH